MNKLMTTADVVAQLRDGMTIGFGGWGPRRKPMAIVAVSARAAARGEANMAAYCAAKSALQRLVESLSAEVREHGIRVNSVAPSIIDTPANRQAMPDADPSRWVSREGLAGTLAFLLSDAARDIHGTHLVVSGLC